jgi:hypothetical protein
MLEEPQGMVADRYDTLATEYAGVLEDDLRRPCSAL